MRGNGERGSIPILALAIVGLAWVFTFGVARLGGATVHRAEADATAEVTALAAADALALGKGERAAIAAARKIATANDAVLIECNCRGTAAEVVIETEDAHITGRARAEIQILPL